VSHFDSRQICVCQKFLVGRAGVTSECPWDGPAQGVEGEGQGMERKYFTSCSPSLPCNALQDI